MVQITGASKVLGAISAASLLSPAPATAREQISVDVSAGVSAATNPFLSDGNDNGAGSGFVEISPLLTMDDEVSTLSLRGYARVEQYTRLYSTDEAAALNLDVTRRISDRFKLRAGAAFRTNRSSAQDLLTDRAISLIPVVGLDPQLGDVTFIGRRTRTVSASATVGGSYSLNATSALDADVAVGVFKYKDPLLSDYRYADEQVGYSRIVSERTSIKASVSFGQIDYLSRRTGDASIISPLLGVATKLGPNLRAEAAAGVSLTRVRLLDGSHSNSTGLALRGSLCGDQQNGTICINLNRSSQPTALGDVSTLTSVGASLSRRLNRRDTLQLNANYSRSSDRGTVLNTHPTFLGASAQFTRQYNQRLAVFAGGSYADIFDSGLGREANLQARVGLRYRFGAVR